jgi:hypothetical protein
MAKCFDCKKRRYVFRNQKFLNIKVYWCPVCNCFTFATHQSLTQDLKECPICGSREHTDGRCEALANDERFN